MRAAVYHQYGPPEVVHIDEIPTPQPKDNEILIRVHATTVSTGDWRARSMQIPRGFGTISRLFFGIRRPRQPILGTELSGVVEALGAKVTRYRVGDEVIAFPGAKMGCHAEYRILAEDAIIVSKPGNLSHEEAAALGFGGTTALDFLRRAGLKRDERILVNGASGSVGTAAVQLAKHRGAHVTGVCSSANLQLVRGLGADEVIDYNQEDLTRTGKSYDVIMDNVGNLRYKQIQHMLPEGGRLLVVLGDLQAMLGAAFVRKHKVIAGPASEKTEYLEQLARLAENGDYQPVIDKVYPLEEIVEAHRHVDTGHKKGNVVVKI
jgi:NADPH:quinone reductase-like Zn-dependent oxidoreductase